MRNPFNYRFGLPSPFYDNEVGSFTAFSPSALFAANEPGVWFDPSDLTTLFQDPAGTTAVTTPGQTVGLMLDKSRGLTLGPEAIVNGDFSSGATGWTLTASATVSAGVLNVSSASYEDFATQSLVGYANKPVRFKATITRTSGSMNIFVGGALVGLPIVSTVNIDMFMFAGSSQSSIRFRSEGGFVGTIDNISVRELAGNHATQATLAARPTYAIEPAGGRRNLLLATNDLTSSLFWTGVNGITRTGGQADPFGGTTGCTFLETAGGTFHTIFSSTTVSLPSGNSTVSVYYKLLSGTRNLLIGPSDGSANYGGVYVNTATNLVQGYVSVGGITLSNGLVENIGSGVYRLTANISNTATRNIAFVFQFAPSGTTTWAANYTGDGTSAVVVSAPQLELGSTATAYQKVTTAYDVTEAGVASMSYLYFDGVNDAMATSTITPGIDKAQVFAGVRKLTDAQFGIVAESSVDINSNQGTLSIAGPTGTVSPVSGSYSFRSRGSTVGGLEFPSTYVAPITNVLTGLGDISGDRATLRINGTQAAQSTADQGTGNYLAYPLYLGGRAGTSLFFTGHLYSLITRFGANLDTPTITNTETWVAGKTGFFTPVITGVPTIGVS